MSNALSKCYGDTKISAGLVTFPENPTEQQGTGFLTSEFLIYMGLSILPWSSENLYFRWHDKKQFLFITYSSKLSLAYSWIISFETQKSRLDIFVLFLLGQLPLRTSSFLSSDLNTEKVHRVIESDGRERGKIPVNISKYLPHEFVFILFKFKVLGPTGIARIEVIAFSEKHLSARSYLKMTLLNLYQYTHLGRFSHWRYIHQCPQSHTSDQ